MGTSSSSSGPQSGVSFDPPWLDPVSTGISNPLEQAEGDDSTNQPTKSDQTDPRQLIAPAGRFGGARRMLNEYGKSGDKKALGKALGSYSKKGMGGASRLAKRMKVSTSSGSALFQVLNEAQDNSNPKINEWLEQLSTKQLNTQELVDEIINKVVPSNGSLDEESCKHSMANAFSDILESQPDIDLLNMNTEQIWTVMESFITNEALNRVILDIGQLFESASFSAQTAYNRTNEMYEYLEAEISAQMQKLRNQTIEPTFSNVNRVLESAIKVTFEIFEEEL